jgi:hypothetical protein
MLETLLRALPALGPTVAALPEVADLIAATIKTLSPQSQEQAKNAYRDLMADNDEGFARLDAKLAAAERR